MMKASGRPIFGALRRAYSAQTQAKVVTATETAALPKQGPKVTRLPNGAIVASLENYSPVSRVAIIYNAGPRYENGENMGVSHCLRNAVNLSVANSTGFGISRNIQQIGGSLDCSTTREHMIYSAEFVRDSFDVASDFLGQVACGPAFKPWEMEEALSRVKTDLTFYNANPQAQLMEAIHKAAYRTTLGRSLYMPEHKIGAHSGEMCKQFIDSHYVSANMVLVGMGVEHDQLLQMSKNLTVNQGGAAESEKAAYVGGEVRVDTNSPLVQAAIVTEGTGLGSSDIIAQYILCKVMGSGQYVKYGSNVATSKVSKAVGACTNSPFAASCLSASYSDGGLFGFQVVTNSADIGKVLRGAMGVFAEATKGGITDQDVTRAKAQLRAALHMEMECGATQLEDIGLQALLSGQVLSAADADAAIEKVTTADVQNVAKKVINGKASMAAVGNLAHTPFLDQLL